MKHEVYFANRYVTKCQHCCRNVVPDKVCHHCGQPMCQDAPIPSLPKRRKNVEFDAIELPVEQMNMSAVHCEGHAHGVLLVRRPFVRWGSFFIFIGTFIWFAQNNWIGSQLHQMMDALDRTTALWLVLVGGGLIFIGQILHWLFFSIAARRQRPPMPLFPIWEKHLARETVKLNYEQTSEGAFRVTVGSLTGHVELYGHLSNEDRTRWQEFRKRYGQLGSRKYIVGLGFIAFQSSKAEVRSEQNYPWNQGICLLQSLAGDIGWLHDEQKKQSILHQWNYELPFEEVAKVDGWIAPGITISAGYVTRSSRKSLEIIIQLDPKLQSRLRQVSSFTLRLNPAWGVVEEAEPNIGISPARKDESYLHRWSRIPIDPNQRSPLVFSISTSEAIAAEDSVSGTIELTFDGNLSDVDLKQIYNAFGHVTTAQSVEKRTDVLCAFQLALAPLTYPEEVSTHAEVQQLGTLPDYRLTNQLSSVLAHEGFYVKQMSENPATVSRANADVQQRVWDIKGRRYSGLQPVDFHLVISGEEQYGRRQVPEWGYSRIEIAVQGVVANEIMTRYVDETSAQLKDIANDVLRSQMIRVMPGLPAPSGAPSNPNIMEDNVKDVKTSIEDDDIIDAQYYTLPQVDALLEQAEQLFIERKITPEQYRETRDRYEEIRKKLYATGRTT